MKTEFPYKWNFLYKKSAYPYDYFNSIDDFQKPVNLKKEDLFCQLKNDFPIDEETERTKKILSDNKNGEELTKLYLKSDIILLTGVFEKFMQVSIKDFKINPLYCVSLPGLT